MSDTLREAPSLQSFAEGIRDGKWRGADARRIATFVLERALAHPPESAEPVPLRQQKCPNCGHQMQYHVGLNRLCPPDPPPRRPPESREGAGLSDEQALSAIFAAAARYVTSIAKEAARTGSTKIADEVARVAEREFVEGACAAIAAHEARSKK